MYESRVQGQGLGCRHKSGSCQKGGESKSWRPDEYIEGVGLQTEKRNSVRVSLELGRT